MSSIFDKDLLTRRELSIITRINEKTIDELVQAGYLSRNGFDDDNNELFLNDTNAFFNAYRQYQIDMNLTTETALEDDDEVPDFMPEYLSQEDEQTVEDTDEPLQSENLDINMLEDEEGIYKSKKTSKKKPKRKMGKNENYEQENQSLEDAHRQFEKQESDSLDDVTKSSEVSHEYTDAADSHTSHKSDSLLERFNVQKAAEASRNNDSLVELFEQSLQKKDFFSVKNNGSDKKDVFKLDTVFHTDKSEAATESASSPVSKKSYSEKETDSYVENGASSQQTKYDASQSLLERYERGRMIASENKKKNNEPYSFAETQQSQLKKDKKEIFHLDSVFHNDKTGVGPTYNGLGPNYNEACNHTSEKESDYELRPKTRTEQQLCEEMRVLQGKRTLLNADSKEKRKVFIFGTGQNMTTASERTSTQTSYHSLPKKKYHVQDLNMSIRNTVYSGDKQSDLMQGRIRTNRLNSDRVILDAIGLGTLKSGINSSDFGSGLRQVYTYSAPLLSMLIVSGYKKIYLDRMDQLKKLDVSRIENVFNANRVFVSQEEIKNKMLKISFNDMFSLRHNLIACDRYFMQRGLGRISHLDIRKLKALLKNKMLNAEDIIILQFLIKIAPARDAMRLANRNKVGKSFKNMFRMLFRGCDAIDGMFLALNVYKAAKSVTKIMFRTLKGLSKLGARTTLLAGKAVFNMGKAVYNTKTVKAFRYMADQSFIAVAPKANAKLKIASQKVGTGAKQLKNVAPKVGGNVKFKQMERLFYGKKGIKGRIKNKFTGVFRRTKLGRVLAKPFKILKIPGYIGKLIGGAISFVGIVSVFMFILFCIAVLIMAVVDSMEAFSDMVTVSIDGEDIQMSPAEYGRDVVERLNAKWEDGAMDYNYIETDEPIIGLADEEIIEATKVILGLPENKAKLAESNMKNIVSIALAVYNANITTENLAYYEETITNLWSVTHSIDPDDATYSDVYECNNSNKNCGVKDDETGVYVCNGHIDKTIKAEIISDFDDVIAVAEEMAGITLTEQQKKDAREYAKLDWESLYGINTNVSGEAFGNVFTDSEISKQMMVCLNAWRSSSGNANYTISPERQLILKTAFGSIGRIPYYWGGSYSKPGYEGNNFGSTLSTSDYRGRNKKGLDCSHYTSWVYDTAAALNENDSLKAHFGCGINTGGLVSAAQNDSYKIGAFAYKCALKASTDRKHIQPGDMWVKLKTATGGDGSSHALIILYPADASTNTYVVAECSGKGTKISTKKLGYGGGTHYILNFLGD